jgi:hypothetical protein
MKKIAIWFIKNFPVTNLEPVTTFARLFTRSMHETSNRLIAQAILPAVVAAPGNSFFNHLKRRQTNPLLFPAVI